MKHNIEIDFILENLKLNFSKDRGDCHTNSNIIANALKKLGYDVKVCTGIYYNPPKKIKHSWIEYKDKILETDCKQLREECDGLIPKEPFSILNKEKVERRYIKYDEAIPK